MIDIAVTGRRARGMTLLTGLLSCGSASALDYEWRDIDITLRGRASVGAMWRMEDRDHALLGKLNVPGQQGLCSRDDCLDLGGDPEPNQRLVDAEGAFIGHAFDDGNLNYAKHDITSAVARFAGEFNATWQDYFVKVSGVGFYDWVNYDGDDFHTDTTHQPRYTPRPRGVNRDLGSDVDLREAFVAASFDAGDHRINVNVGQQILRWGESNLIALNSLAEINPPDENVFWMPGAQIPDAFQPVPLVVVSADLTANLEAEAFYQFGWKPAKAAAAGGFMSLFESANGRDYFLLTPGQTPEDPNGEHRISGLATLLTDSSASARMIPGIGEPSDGGQFGLRLSWMAEDFLGGTQFGFYAANYHSRVPYLSMIAGDESCIRDSTSIAGAIVDCPLLASGSLDLGGLLYHYLGIDVGGLVTPVDIDLSAGRDALPLDSPKGFLDYPEDIRLFGVSFNTTLGSWSLSGEYAYRPNLPVQVALTDVIMTGAQPLFPRQDIVVGLPQLATIPSARTFIPDFLSVYRGYDNSIPEQSIQGGQLIRGYERLKVGQLNLSAIKAFSQSDIPFPLGAEQVLLLVESGFMHVIDMPDIDELQFEGFILHKNTHASPGADGTGAGGVPGLRMTPTQQTEGFADDFAWGYRVSVMMEYNDVFLGINFKPWLIWGHDVQGISIMPKSGYQGFAEGRRFFQIGSEFNFMKDWSGGLFYRGSTGDNDTMRDRDHISAYVAYTF